MGTLKGLLKSRKAWLALVGVLLPVLDKKLGLNIDKEALVAAIMAIIVLIGSIAFEDAAQKHAGGKPKPD